MMGTKAPVPKETKQISKAEIEAFAGRLYPMEDGYELRHARQVIGLISKGGTAEEKGWVTEALSNIVQCAVKDAIAEDEEGKPNAAMGFRQKALNYFDYVRSKGTKEEKDLGTKEEKDLALKELTKVAEQELSKGNVARGASGDYRLEYVASALSILCDVDSTGILKKISDRFRASGNKALIIAARGVDKIEGDILEADFCTGRLTDAQAVNEVNRKSRALPEKQIHAELRKLGKDMEGWHPKEGKKKPAD